MTTSTPKRGTTVPSDWQARFLRTLAKRGTISAACRAARVSRNFVYVQYKADAVFAAAWDEALETACDALEEEAWRRAVDGVAKPVYQGGAKVGSVREYSDGLMTTLLKAHRPAKYRETTRTELTGVEGGAVQVEVNDLRERLARRLAAVTAGTGAPPIPDEPAG